MRGKLLPKVAEFGTITADRSKQSPPFPSVRVGDAHWGRIMAKKIERDHKKFTSGLLFTNLLNDGEQFYIIGQECGGSCYRLLLLAKKRRADSKTHHLFYWLYLALLAQRC